MLTVSIVYTCLRCISFQLQCSIYASLFALLCRFVLEMSINCKHCDQIASVGGPDVIACYGTCNGTFHGKCVSLSAAVMKTIANNPNISWNCDNCNAPTGLISEVMKELKGSLAELTKAVANNTSVLANVVASGSKTTKSFADMASAFPSPATSKRRRVESVAVHTPVPRKTVVGSGSGPVASVELKSVETRKDIVASQLHTSTTEEKLCSYLKEVHSLDTSSSDIRCKILLPNGKNIDDLDWISFKISVVESMYEKVMVSENWPKGVTVRDFERRPRSRSSGVFLSKPNPGIHQMEV